ncbi:hypothetical protein SLH46_12620 [Draconibacterium sp. IB214405]|uniref:hypothetical protein n=1 Tax=Draconibacterium sp. IB214405 TaxID=3097352 RepID=UPI002A113076|nr:hypothetical protein [Draconibacterium sp. IB214405]MDX8340036.1 hypothetical protein [Draconibacterium sp. IB214405]
MVIDENSFIMCHLYRIRNLVRGLYPLYISICAALLIDLKSNISSLTYIAGLLSFIVALIISNILANRCDNYGRIYDIQFGQFIENKRNEPSLKKIYDDKEKKKFRFFKNCSVFILGIIGLMFIILSYSKKNQSSKLNNQNFNLQHQVDSLESINFKYEEIILELKKKNDSIKNVCFDKSLEHNEIREHSRSETDSVGNKN